jgi:hypothetical protein
MYTSVYEASVKWELQDPKMGIAVPFKAIFCGDIPLHSPEKKVLYEW